MPPLIAPDRRTILRLIAAGAAASVAGCRAPDRGIHPMADQPEGAPPGTVRRYATALPLAGYLRGVTGLVTEGRPIKLEGLAAHPASRGATDLFGEVAILDLYDPQRSRAPSGPEGPASWQAVAKVLAERVAGRRGGEGIAILTGRVTSPTVLAQIAAAKVALPGLMHHRWEPLHDDAAMAAARAAYGRRLVARPRLAQADVVLLLDADPLGPGPEQAALGRDWSERRRRAPMPRTYCIEPSPTQSGLMADRRAAAGPHTMAAAVHALAAALGAGGAATGVALPPDLARLVADAARDLIAAKGRALIMVGDRQPAAVHAFALWANARLAASQEFIAPPDPVAEGHGTSLATLAQAMHRGAIDTLLMIDTNPVLAAPPSLDFASGLARVPLTIAANAFPNETAAAARWRLPLSHPLEGWHDGRAPDGTASIAQPLIRPLGDTRTPAETITLLADPAGGDGGWRQVRQAWRALDDASWRRAVAAGVVADTAAPTEAVGHAPLVLPPIPLAGRAIDIRPSPTLYDGRFSTNAWGQECPDPLTKEVWGASARLHPDDMAALGAADGDLLRIDRGGPAIEVAARAVPGQAPGVVTLLAGYGRQGTGAIADGIGGNAWAVGGDGPLRIVRTGAHRPVTTTQHQFRLEGELARLFPVLAPGEALPPPPVRATLLPNPPVREGAPPQYAMAIDTDLCIGCNACVVACQAENNIPAIGPEEMAAGRDMHWLRIDRYDRADAGDIGGFQPVPCMQCEAAPCEPVCPVEASVHDAQGLNLQVYNRCIGTRTCQANCPYKVRRFNFLDYAEPALWKDADADAASVTAQRNPDVTVRARGVMEKCTYCVQRISAATREGDAGGTPGPVVTACQAACPTQAIRFGLLGTPPIAEARADPRHFALLEELGTRPRTTYLARRHNPGGDA